MNTETRNIVIGAVIVIVLVLLGYLVWQERQGSMNAISTATTTATSTGISVMISTSTTATTTADYTITPITTSKTSTSPNYKTPLSFPAGMNADEQAQDQNQFATIQTTLASSPADQSSWIGLGMLREETHDYQGAATDWKYVTVIYPNDPTAYADLGDLYANYLNQPAQGVAYYKKAITLDPTKEETFYQNLAQIYMNEDDTVDAKAVLQQGISAQVIGYQNLQSMLNAMQ